MSSRQPYQPHIDGLRALAICPVVWFHAFPEHGGAGFIGVDIFFVISGYLITGTLLKSGRDQSVISVVLNFYEHRIRRIFPALALVLAVSFVYGWFLLYPTTFQNLKKYIAAGAAFFTNFVLWKESGYFDQAIELKPLMHLWSLAIEEQFYIVWPVAIVSFLRIANGRFLMPALMFGSAISFVYCLYATNSNIVAAYYSPLSRAWELGVGGIFAAHTYRSTPFKDNLATASGLALIAFGLLAIDKSSFPGWQAMFPVCGAALVILGGTKSAAGKNILGFGALRYIGLISYPLYLWHWLLLSFLRIEYVEPSAFLRIATVLASVALAAATFHFVELPIRALKIQKAVLISAGGMTAVLMLAAVAYRANLSGFVITPLQARLSIEVDARPAYRYSRCFLDTSDQTSKDFAAECMPSNDRAKLLIWGDSLAAHFYPGLLMSPLANSLTIAQATATSCPPAASDLYKDRRNCDAMNEAARAYVISQRPDYVLINGRWPADVGARYDQIERITAFLRDNGVRHIVLAGPAPDWTPNIRTFLLRRRFANERLPEMMSPPLQDWILTKNLEANLRSTAAKLCIRYISLVDHFCRENHCRLTVTDDIPDGLVTTDHDHLTALASESLFSKTSPKDLQTTDCRK